MPNPFTRRNLPAPLKLTDIFRHCLPPADHTPCSTWHKDITATQNFIDMKTDAQDG